MSGSAVLALGTIYVVWGSTYLAIRVMVETLPPLLATGFRFLVAGALLGAGIALVRGGAALRVRRRELAAAATTGLLILAGGIGLVTVAEQEASSSLAALVIASVPVWVVVLSALAGDGAAPAAVAGVALGVAGVALVVGGGAAEAGAGWALPALLAAAVLTAAGLFASPRLGLPADALVATVYEMLAAGIALTVAAAAAGEPAALEPGDVSGESALAFAYLVVFGSIVAYGAFVWALQHLPPPLVATYAFVNPVVALVLGWAILDERITATVGAGAALVVLAVAALTRARPAPQG